MVRKFIESYGITLVCLIAALFYVSTADARHESTPLSCEISPQEQTIVAGDSIDFSASTQGGKGTKRYNWEFQAGSPGSSSSSSPIVTYPTAGSSFSVSLTVTDRSRTPANCTTTVTVDPAETSNQPPVAVDDSASTDQDTAVDINILTNDTDPNGNGTIDKTSVAITNLSTGAAAFNTNGIVTYTPALGFTGDDNFSYTVEDDTGAISNSATVTVTVNATGGGGGNSTKSINSTSQNGLPAADVTELILAGNNSYRIFGSNDLGMHCGDFDTRVSSILPPFNILHAQVIQRGSEPNILTPADGINVVYSAASNPDDPVMSGINSAGTGTVLSSVAGDGSVYKTNFWDIVNSSADRRSLVAYRAFYPPGVLDAFAPEPDQGLPMPNVERLWLGDGTLTAEQQDMPGRSGPYVDNKPRDFKFFTVNQPFFNTFPFGYVSTEVNWFEAAGVPMTAFDDAGRENPWPLYRFQAQDNGGNVLASIDVVLPISGEANCGFCHNAPVDGGNGAATQALENADPPITLATVLDDPEFDVSVPLEVSKEYAADLNLLRLHDLKHGTDLENSTPVVCQSCHYTPALDLAQVGPKGPGDADANGRQQTNVRSMSNVMHSHHASVKGTDGKLLFPDMPPAIDSNGNPRDPLAAKNILQNTCYQCHPGRRTDCLRGAMANGGMLCQDCHGQMAQVGDDFSRNVDDNHKGAFELASDFYVPTSATPRVPWANEPGCGSCHTGDATNNLQSASNTLDAQDGIRLMQAYRIGDTKATPIVPTNKRFAENVVTTGDATGNPMLYRVSKGHEGVFCEACHGATHGIWPNKNPLANDNVTAAQLQGHTGTISECTTCHSSSFSIDDFKGNLDSNGWMKGPHGMHPVGSTVWNKEHKEVAHDGATPAGTCEACHGNDGLGTVLSRTATDRVFQCKEQGTLCGANQNTVNVPKDTQIGCVECHDNEIGQSSDD